MCFPNEKMIEKKWDYRGLQCVVVRADLGGRSIMKHRCGYVRVPPSHPWHGKFYDDIDADVHGGLTFAAIEPCTHEDGIGWWIGFDCAHLGDSQFPPGDPDAERYGFAPGEHYWTLPEVQEETESLARLALGASR
jgi:hypothetical protein